MDTYLGIDIGTSHIKAVMIDDRGKVLQKDSVVTPTTEDGIGAVHDAQQLVSACQTIVRQIISSHPQAQVKAISVASFGEEGFLLDERNQPVYASIAWYEQRPICHHGKLASNMYTQQETGLIPSLSYSLFKWSGYQKG